MKYFKFAFLAFCVMLMSACTQIDSGNVGVAKSFGKINLEERVPGTYLTVIETLDEFTTKEVSFQLNDMKPKSKDSLTMSDVDLDIYFKANPQLIAETMAKYQGDTAKHSELVPGSKSSDLVVGFSRVSREAREATYKAIAMQDATTIHTKRDEISSDLQRILQAELDKGDPGVWTVTGVNVRNLVTDKGIEEAIRQKVATDQAIDRAKKEKELAEAQGLAAIETARAQAKANEIIAASLTPGLLRIKEIEAQKAFAGQGTHTIMLNSGGSTPIFNVGK